MVQAEYLYNAQGQQVRRDLTQAGQIIHLIHDLDGNRIAEYLYDDVAGTSSLIREYVWLEDRPVAVIKGGVIYYVRTDHIGRRNAVAHRKNPRELLRRMLLPAGQVNFPLAATPRVYYLTPHPTDAGVAQG